MESSSSAAASRPIMTPTVTVSGISTGNGSPGKPAESITSITAHRRKRLVRSENVCCSHHQGWEAIFRESLLHMAWPISLSLSSDQADSLAMTDFLPLKIRSVSSTSVFVHSRRKWARASQPLGIRDSVHFRITPDHFSELDELFIMLSVLILTISILNGWLALAGVIVISRRRFFFFFHRRPFWLPRAGSMRYEPWSNWIIHGCLDFDWLCVTAGCAL